MRDRSRAWPEDSLLGALDPAGRDRLLATGEDRRYQARQVLMREGEYGDCVLVLVDGLVKAVGAAYEGRDVLLAIRMGGDLVGELAGMDGKPRSATVIACGPVTARRIAAGAFRDFLRREPHIAAAVATSLTGKLRAANSYRVDFAGCDAKTRMTRALYHLAMTYGRPSRDGHPAEGTALRLPVTQPELATLCGISDTTGHRALSELSAAGLISTGYGAIMVADVARLRPAAFGD